MFKKIKFIIFIMITVIIYPESKNLNIEELRKMFTPRTIYRLENGSEISIYIIEKICCKMHCQPGDFMEYINDK